MRHTLKQYEITYENGSSSTVNAFSIKDALKTERQFFGDINVKDIKRKIIV